MSHEDKFVRPGHKSEHHSKYKLLTWATASTFEAKCHMLLQNSGLPFLKGYEGGRVDCGMLATEEIQLGKDYSQQLFDTVPAHGKKNCLLALDFKTTNAKLRPADEGGLYFHSFYVTKDEAICSAFIVQNPEAPELVALIPTDYLTSNTHQEHGDHTHYGRDVPLTGRAIELFPLEWSPFVLPFVLLPKALASLRGFCAESRQLWQNPYYELEFVRIAPPKLCSVDHLLSASKNSDFESIRSLWNAFREYGTCFHLERLVIQPGHSDFMLVHTQSGRSTAVELKRRSAHIVSDRTFEYLSRLDENGNFQSAFYPSASWDHLLVRQSDHAEQFCFISRDEFPADFFKESNISEAVLSWHFDDTAFLTERSLDFASPSQFVLKLERILLEHLNKGSFRAIREPQRDSLNQIERTHHASQRKQNEAEIAVATGGILAPLRGTGRRWARWLWEASHEELLLKQLSARTGALIRLGLHTCGTYVYAPYTEPGTTFSSLHPKTPLVYINFASVVLDDRWIPSDGRRPLPFLPATHGHCPSIFLVAHRIVGMENVKEHMYVLPSQLLNTKNRRDYHDEVLGSMIQGATRNHQPVTLTSQEHIARYRVPYKHVMNAVATLVEKALKHDPGLITNKAGVVTEFLKLYTGETYWEQYGVSADEFNLALESGTTTT